MSKHAIAYCSGLGNNSSILACISIYYFYIYERLFQRVGDHFNVYFCCVRNEFSQYINCIGNCCSNN